jgi:hypothetical protein
MWEFLVRLNFLLKCPSCRRAPLWLLLPSPPPSVSREGCILLGLLAEAGECRKHHHLTAHHPYFLGTV